MEELEKNDEQFPEEEAPLYMPRPRWQVWAARIGLALFILVLLMYYVNLVRGGI